MDNVSKNENERLKTPPTSNCSTIAESETKEQNEATTNIEDTNDADKSSVASELLKLVKDEIYLISIGCVSLICSTMSNSGRNNFKI